MELTLQEKLRLINFFEFLLDKEVSKPLGEMDSEAVDNYIKILLHLQDKHIELSPEFIDEQVRKIFHPEENTAPETVKTTKKHYKKTKVWLVAACIAILVALFSIASVAFEWDVFDFLTEKFGSVYSTPIEEEQNFNGVSVIYYGKYDIYTNIEKALKAKKINILYPTVLPKDTDIKEIALCKETSKDKLIYLFSNPDLYSEILFNTSLSQSVFDNATEIITIDTITCYICDMPDISSVQLEFEYKGNSYFFSHTDKDVLIKIIENLKEINYEN